MSKIVGFTDMNVKIEQHYAQEWTAHEADNYDYDSPMGYGSTMIEAICDLNEKLEECGK